MCVGALFACRHLGFSISDYKPSGRQQSDCQSCRDEYGLAQWALRLSEGTSACGARRRSALLEHAPNRGTELQTNHGQVIAAVTVVRPIHQV